MEATLTEPPVWVTAYGESIPVDCMTSEHIFNCIRCWNGQGLKNIPPNYLGGKDKWLHIFDQELTKRIGL